MSVFVKYPYDGHCDSKAFKACVLFKMLPESKRVSQFSAYREEIMKCVCHIVECAVLDSNVLHLSDLNF